jgi:hypothetical protein
MTKVQFSKPIDKGKRGRWAPRDNNDGNVVLLTPEVEVLETGIKLDI